jgi:predicted TIM-barrel fold metal-dependent hydrolase
MNDEYWQAKPAPVDPEFFALARKFDGFVMPITPEGLQRLEAQTGLSITNLAGLKRAMEHEFQLALKVNMRAIKTPRAYQRDLHFATTTIADAWADFERLARGEGVVSDEKRRLERRPFRALSNHMFHHLVQLADAHSVPMQIHTGLQAGNGNFVEHSQPSQLSNIFLRYPRVQFDVFHIGFPYHHEVTVLAKMFPNVYADFCWMHIVSPSAARVALDEMLDSVPANKIFGFGGDYRYPELSYAHLIMARRNIATVLAGRVEKGDFTEEDAAATARWLLHDNPAALFAKQTATR